MDILAYALALVVFAVVMLLRKSRIRRASFDSVIERLEKQGLSFDKKVFDAHNRFALLADTAKRKWVLLEQGSAYLSKPAQFDTLLGYSLWEDNRLKTAGGKGFEDESSLSGRALVKTQQNTCTHMEIRLRLSTEYRPIVILPLIDGETRKDSITYETAKTVAKEVFALLEDILKQKTLVFERPLPET